MSNEANSKSFPGRVATILPDKVRLAINRGAEDGVRHGQRFLVYALSSEPITDPETGEKLGYLELVRGTGKVVNVQPKLATIESDTMAPTTRRTIRNSLGFGFGGDTIETEPGKPEPFEDVIVGDYVKPV